MISCVEQEAVDIVQRHLHRGYHEACQELIETAAARWQEEEGDYRDDVSFFAVCWVQLCVLEYQCFVLIGNDLFLSLVKKKFVQISAIVVKFPLPYNMS